MQAMLASGDPRQRDPSTSALNWQEPPHNRWSFWHVRELLPTQRVSRGDGAARDLPRADRGDEVLAVDVSLRDGSRRSVADVFDRTYTDAYAVAQDGALVAEGYAPTGGPARTHAVMSVTKSVVGCVAAILEDRDVLGLDRTVESYVPELGESGYAGATVRQLLDMRSGVRFREQYTNPRAEVRRLDRWIAGGSQRRSASTRGLYPFLTTLREEAPHGSRFLYRSSETDVLGWVCERAGGTRMADLISELLWAPMRAEHDAELICDTLGTAVHDGGLAATTIDLLRFGQMILDGGSVADRDGEAVQVVPARWLRRSWTLDADARRAFLSSPAEATFPGGWYRNQFWFRPSESGSVLMALGIHGQLLQVSRQTGTVGVKLSSWPDAQNPVFMRETLGAFDAIAATLARQSPATTSHLPGVVSGLSRGGAASRRRGRSS